MSDQEPKRRKVSLACVECRERKRKCDGQRPRCGNCAKRNPPPDCVYSDETLKRGSSSYVESLRNRIKELEDQVRQTQNQGSPLSPPTSDVTRLLALRHETSSLATTVPSSTASYDDRPAHTQSATTEWSNPPRKVQETPAESTLPRRDVRERGLDQHGDPEPQTQDYESEYLGIGAMGTPGGRLCPHCRGLRVERNEYTGVPNPVDFDRQIRQWTVNRSDSTQPRTVPKVCHCWAGRSMNLSRAMTRWSVPRRAEADALVDSYFGRVYSLYPFLVRQTFMQSYLQLWQPASPHQSNATSDSDSDVFYCLLNAVFALGSQYSPELDSARRASTSEMFYNRAIASLKFQLMERGNIELVQTLLLTAQYLQSTQSWEMCWNLAGMAVRIAQGIGLHMAPLDSAQSSKEPAFLLEEAMRRRVWAGCVTLDRVLAMLYGKPSMLHPSSTRTFIDNLPTQTDDELRGSSESSGGDQVRMIDFFVSSLKLIHILGDILDLHRQRTGSSATTEHEEESSRATGGQLPVPVRNMLRLDNVLVGWRKQLPSHLQTTSGDPTSLFTRQAQVLRARFLHMRVFLLRPVLLTLHQYTAEEESLDNESAQDQVAFDTLTRTAKTCLDVTVALIDLVYNDVHSSAAPAIVWWYGIYYIYFCATVVHAGRLCAHLPVLSSGKSLQQSFQNCLLCLQKYEAFGLSARKCHTALEMLEKRAFPDQTQPGIPLTADWASVAGSVGQQGAKLDQAMQFSIPTEYASMYGGGPGFFSSDADNFFWTTFVPDANMPF